MLIPFLAIQQYLGTKFPDVTYIRLWNNNLEKLLAGEDEIYNTVKEAFFIEFPDNIQWDQLGNGVQGVASDDLRIKIHIIQDFYDSQDGSMSQNLEILFLGQQVYQAFQDWMPSTVTIASGGLYNKYAGTYPVPIGVMRRINDYQDKNHPNVYHFIQEYSTSWIDVDMNRPVGGILSTPILDYELDLIPDWIDTELYTVDQYVKYTDNNIYQCILNTTVAHEVPTNTIYWKYITKA